MYSSKSNSNSDSDAIFKIAGSEYTIKFGGEYEIDYWDILGQRTLMQHENYNLIDPKTGKFKTDKYYSNFRFSGDKNSPLNDATFVKENGKVYIKLKNGQKYLADEVMAGKYNNILKK